MSNILALILVITFAFSQQDSEKSTMKSKTGLEPYIAAIKILQQKIAPDRRIAVFDVHVSKSGKKLVLKGEVGSPDILNEVENAVRQTGNAVIIDSIAILPEHACMEQPFAVVKVSVAPLRAKPSESAEMITQALMGSVLKVLKVKGSWMYIQQAEGNYLGWIDVDQCVRQTEEQSDGWKTGSRIFTTSYIDLVRIQPSQSAQPVCDVTAGALLRGKEYDKEWFAVSLPDGRTGFLLKTSGMDYAQWKETRKPTPENIEKTAQSFLGIPYLWGGTSPKGFDCSGFTKTVFKLNGIDLQRDADQQGMAGESVSLEKDMSMLKKGDLLFFGAKASPRGPERITHVGIYLGQKEFIHCSSLVKVNSFDPSSAVYNQYLLHRLVKVKRFLPGN